MIPGLADAMNSALRLERAVHGPVAMTPRGLRQTTFTAEVNQRLFKAISSQPLVLDGRTDAFLQSLRDSVDYDRQLYSCALPNDQLRFLDNMFTQTRTLQPEYVSALWYSKIVGDVESTLCNATPLTYPSTIFFAERSHVAGLSAALDRGTVSWTDDQRVMSIRNVQYAYGFLRLLHFGMSTLEI